MAKYIQDNLPEFSRICAEAREKGVDKVQHLAKAYIRYTKMMQLCKNPQTMKLLQKGRQILTEALGRPQPSRNCRN